MLMLHTLREQRGDAASAGYGRTGGMSSSRCKCSWPRTNTTQLPQGDRRWQGPGAGGERVEQRHWTRRLLPPGRQARCYFSIDDDGDVLAARPTPLVEVRPLPGVLLHTAAHIEDVVPYVQILDVPVPQLGDQVVEFLQKIDAPALDEQVIAVPKIFLDRIPQCSACRRPRRAEQLVEVPTIVSYASLQQRTAEPIIDIPVPEGRGDRGGGRSSRFTPRTDSSAWRSSAR